MRVLRLCVQATQALRIRRKILGSLTPFPKISGKDSSSRMEHPNIPIQLSLLGSEETSNTSLGQSVMASGADKQAGVKRPPTTTER